VLIVPAVAKRSGVQVVDIRRRNKQAVHLSTTPMTNITFITHTDGLYGANRSLLALLSEAKTHGVEPSVIVPSVADMSQKLSEMDIPYTAAPIKQWMSRQRWKAPARLAMNLLLLPRLANQLRRWGTDRIHTNSSVTPIGALLGAVTGTPHTWHVREFGSLDYGLRHDWGQGVFEWGLSRAQGIVSVSRVVKETVLANVTAPCSVIYNGVITESELETMPDQMPSAGSREGAYTFSLLGWIRPEKGQAEAIRALAHLVEDGLNVRLLIAGTGEEAYENEIRELVAARSLGDYVEFLGFVDDPYEVYEQSDAVLVASMHEAMGRVTAEGMAAMRPIIGHNQAGTGELVTHEKDGLLYDGTVDDLAAKMKDLATDDPSVSARMGEEGWRKARTWFTVEGYAARVYRAMGQSSSVSAALRG
jgi:glycosyltransferase involved in cell wall biosynthesis